MAAQTITTVVNYDSPSVTGLLHAETVTITGGDLTIDSDIRHCQNSAVLGAVTCSSNGKNKLTITGENTWEIPFGGYNKIYSNSSLLIGFDTSIVDESPNPKTLTTSGSPTLVTASSFGFGEKRLSFNTAYDAIDIAHSGTDFDLGTGDFMFFMEFQCDTAAAERNLVRFCSLANGYAALRISTEYSQIRVRMSSNGSSWAVNRLSPNAFTSGQPTVLMMYRKGNDWNLYLNNILADTWVSSASLMPNSGSCTHRIGANSDGTLSFIGFMDEITLVKGLSAVYTSPIDHRKYNWDRTTWTSGASSGLVPTLGTLGTNTVTGLTSGATGELMRVFTRDLYLDTADVVTQGAAMPDFGYIKLRSKTGTFIAGETISLPGGATIVAKDAGRRSWINVPARETSILSLSKATDVSFKGDWYLLGVTDGKANQVFMFPLSDMCPAIYVETGPGTNQYEWWLNAGSRWGQTPQTVATDTRGKYFGCNYNTGSIRIARRTQYNDCGYLPPAGCRVYIGNVILSNTTSASSYLLNTTNATLTNRYTISTSANGSFKTNKVTCNWYTTLSNSYSIDIRDSSFLSIVNISNPTLRPYINNIGIGISITIDTVAFYCNLSPYGIDVIDVYCSRYLGNAANTWPFLIADCGTSVTITRGVYHIFGNSTDASRGNATIAGLSVQRASNVTVTQPKIAGGYLHFYIIINATATDIKYADLVMGETNTTNSISAVTVSNICSNIYINGVSNYDNISNVHPYSSILNTNTTNDNVTLTGIGTQVAPYNCGTNANKMGSIVTGNSTTNLKIKQCYLVNNRLGPLVTSNTFVGFEAYDVWGDYGLTQTINCMNATIRNCKWTRVTAGSNAVYGKHFDDYSMSNTNKYLNIAFNEPSAKTLPYIKLYGYNQSIAYPRWSRFLQNGTGTLSEDQLTISGAINVRANTSVDASSGTKWDWEVTIVSITDTAIVGVGRSTSTVPGQDTGCVAYLSTGEILLAGVTTAYGAVYVAGDVIGVAMDMAANTLTFFKNGVSQGVAITGMTGTYFPTVGRSTYNASYTANFGQNTRAYAVQNTYTKDYGNPPAFFTAAGSLVMPNLSDEIILEMDYFMMGATAMANVGNTFTGTNSGNFNMDFQYDLGSGYNGTWLPLNATSFVTVNSINPQTGIKLKVRLVPAIASSSNTVTYVLVPFVTDTVSQSYTVPEPIVLINGSVTGLVAGSRVRVFNKTTNLEVYNVVASSTSVSFSYENNVDIHTNDVLEIRVTSFSGATAKLPYVSNVIASATGWSIYVSQVEDSIYDTINLDGSTMTEFSMDTVNNFIKINSPSKETTAQRLYAWVAYYRNTEAGIRTIFNTLEAIDILNYRRDPTNYVWYLYNELLTSVRLSGAYVYSSDDSNFIADTVAGVSGSIFLDPKKAYGVTVGTSGLTPSESLQLASITTVASQASVDTATKLIRNAIAIAASN